MRTKEEIYSILASNRSEILNFGVNKLGVFGSYSRDEQTENSDIDLLVDFSKPIGLVKFFQLHEKLESLLNNKVDLITLKSLNKNIRNEVLSELVYI